MKKTVILSAAALSMLVAPSVLAEEVTIQAGDTLSEIAEAHNVDVDFLVRLNGIAEPDFIIAGEKLYTEEADVAGTATVTVTEAAPAQETEVVQYTAPQVETPVSAVPYSEEPASTPVESTPVVDNSYTSTVVGSDAAAKEEIARRESGGSYTATNGIYYGRYQLTNSYLNGDYSAANQERVADQYVADRYGSWSNALAFWNANGWYYN